MGVDTYFHGELTFNRSMTRSELDCIAQILRSPCPLRITDDQRGLCYWSEKTRDLVECVNWITSEVRKHIPDFTLRGMLAADTEYEPYLWFLKLSEDGTAFDEPTNEDNFLAFRRSVYPGGYCGCGLIDRKDYRNKSYWRERWMGEQHICERLNSPSSSAASWFTLGRPALIARCSHCGCWKTWRQLHNPCEPSCEYLGMCNSCIAVVNEKKERLRNTPQWFCPWCDEVLPEDQQCNCAPCAGCGARAYWACVCPGEPDEKGNIRSEDMPF